jgi:hypothetical protein
MYHLRKLSIFYLSHFSFMRPKVVFRNVLLFHLSQASFTDVYPEPSTYRGATIELASLAYAAPSYAGHFSVSVVSSADVSGFYMLSRASRPAGDRRPYPRLGVPDLDSTPPAPVASLPEVLSEYIGSGLLCPESIFDSSSLVVDVFYRFRLQESLLLTFAVDSATWPPTFQIGILLSFDSSVQLPK